MHRIEMEFGKECCVFGLVYEPSMKIDTSLPQIFQKKTKAVSIRCMVYYALIFEFLVNEICVARGYILIMAVKFTRVQEFVFIWIQFYQ
jgi:hypothetical protein